MLHIHEQGEFYIVVSYLGSERRFVETPVEIGTTMPQWQNLPQLQHDLENACLVVSLTGQKTVQIQDREMPFQKLVDRVYSLRPSDQPEYCSRLGRKIYHSMARKLAQILYQPMQNQPSTLCQRVVSSFKRSFECFSEGREATVLADSTRFDRRLREF